MFPSQRKGPPECSRGKSMRLRGYTLIIYRVKECQFEFDRKKNTGIKFQTLLRITSFFTFNITLAIFRYFSKSEIDLGRLEFDWEKNGGLSGYALIFFKEPGRVGSQTHVCVPRPLPGSSVSHEYPSEFP